MTILDTMVPVAPPLSVDEHGSVRIAGTRVTLDSVVLGYLDGQTAEQLADSFPSVGLEEIYETIGYYLRNRSVVDEYLRRRQAEEEAARSEAERRWPTAGLRERLLARCDPDRRASA